MHMLNKFMDSKSILNVSIFAYDALTHRKIEYIWVFFGSIYIFIGAESKSGLQKFHLQTKTD